MKKILIILLINLCILNSKDEFPFDITILDCKFNGCLEYNNNLLVYGEYGNILSSSDKGENWDQKSIGDSINIVKLIPTSNKLVGISSNYIISSNINGNEWYLKEFNNSQLIDIAFENEFIFVLTKENLIKYDLNLNQKDVISIDVNSGLPLKMQIDKNNAYVICNSYDVLEINLNTNYTNVYKNTNKANKLSNANNLQYLNNHLYFVNLDTLIDYDLKNLEINKLGKAQAITNFQNTIYTINSESFSNKPPTVYFSKVEAKKIVIVSEQKIDRVVDTMNFNNLYFLDTNYVVAIGNGKLIYKSKNLGLNWELKSFRSNVYYRISCFSNKTFYVTTRGLITYKSNDKGITWLPQKFIDSTIYNYKKIDPKLSYFDSLGNGIIWTTEKYANIAVTNDKAETFKYKYIDSLDYYSPNIPNFARYKDGIVLTHYTYVPFKSNYVQLIYYFDNKYNLIHQFVLDSLYFERTFNVGNELFGLVENQYNSKSSLSGKDTTIYSYYIFKASESSIAKWDYVDSINTIKRMNPNFKIEDEKLFFLLGFGKGTVLYYDSLGKLDISKTEIGYELDSLAFYDFNLHHYKIILGATEYVSPYYLKFDDIYYFQGDTNYFMSNNIFDKSSWISRKNAKYKLNQNSKINGSIVTASKLGTYEQCFIQPNSNFKTEVIETQTEEQTYFYSYPPFPNPAMNELKSLIYWDMGFNIDDSDIGVYDIYGNKVADKEKISVNKLNAYSGYLTWDCSGIATGIYMIQIKHGTNTHNIRAMVVR
ncbi:MAG: hypothetical protein NTW25_13815 [Candidatus Kapabacteria bacterium]|nr:hypothetical protein [Candidatus Kapabacteria bacterium]